MKYSEFEAGKLNSHVCIKTAWPRNVELSANDFHFVLLFVNFSADRNFTDSFFVSLTRRRYLSFGQNESICRRQFQCGSGGPIFFELLEK